ncbi:MAG: FGGY-family carbohydrate kinase [Candidatus Humimicrobiaceae bacterium]
MKYFLGIDFGTGGAKACITDTEMNTISYAFQEYDIIIEKPGWSEHDPDNYWKLTKDLISECIKKGRVAPKDIAAIATSSALPAMVMLDKKGNTINRAYNLLDRRAKKEVDWVRDTLGAEEIFKITGNRLEDHPALVNLLWEKRNRPCSFKKICKVYTIDSFIKYRLTGVSNINYSQGVYYGVAYDIRKNTFNQEILNMIGIDKSILPEATQSEVIIGHVTQQAALECGLVAGIPVAAGQADAMAGWLGAGAIFPGDMQINLGTCGVIGIVHKNSYFLDTMINSAYTIPGTFVVIAATNTGGQLIRYMRDNFAQIETAVEKLTGVSSYQMLDIQAEKVRPGSEGLIVLPYFMGEKTPIWDNNAKGVFFGLTLNHSKGHILRSMMESVAYALYESFVMLKKTMNVINYPAVFNEGGAVSKIWREIITDVFNIPTILLKNRAGAPYGDCLLAAKATGFIKDYSIAREKVQYIELMEPQKRNNELYMGYFELYKKVYISLKERFIDLNALKDKFE